MELKTKFDVKQEVEILPLKVVGRILAVYLDTDGLQYRVRYFDHAAQYTEYFFEDELK